MYLKNVEIHGFKSFVDRVKLEFGPGVTVIVGPNGSGKSNITDAVLWVLGEQSLKSLRGRRTEDIIFAGSETRRPVGMAEVSLCIDNSDGSIPMDFQEIEVTRRCFRSGEGEYYLNKASCRLKDIQELFLDTGSGKDGLAIIGQGRLEEIISMRPEERRLILEETAGITRYRLRKKEARQRLETVEQDLLRLGDLTAELKSQLEQAAVEADRARRYQKLDQLLSLTELAIRSQELAKARNRHQRSQRCLQALAAKTKNNQTLKQEWIDKAREIKAQILKRENIQNLSRNELQVLYRQAEKIQGQLDMLKEKQVMLVQQQQEIKKTEQFLAKGKSDLNSISARLKTQKETWENEKEKLEKTIKVAREDENKLASEIKTLTAELERIKNTLFQITHERTGCHTELVRLEEKHAALERLLQQKNSQIKSYRTEEKVLNESLLSELKKCRQAEARLQHLEKQKECLQREILSKEQELAKQEKQLTKLSERQRALLTKLKILHQARATYEGFAGGVRFILKNRDRGEIACAGVIGVVVDQLTVPAELTLAVDVALGGAAQQILVPTAAEAETVIQYLKKQRAGRVTILPLNWLEYRRWPSWADWVLREEGVIGIISDLVSCEPEIIPAVSYLLGHFLVVKNIDKALKLGVQLRPPIRLVTLDGEIIQPRGAVTGGGTKRTGGFLKQRLEIEQQESELAVLRGEIKNKQQRLKGLEYELQSRRQQLGQMTEMMYSYRNEHQLWLQKYANNQEQLVHLKEKLTVLTEELQQKAVDSCYLDKEKDQKQELLARLKFQEEKTNKDLIAGQQQLMLRQQALAAIQQKLAADSARLQALIDTWEQLSFRQEELQKQQKDWRRQQEELEIKCATATALEKELNATEKRLLGEQERLQDACRQKEIDVERLQDENYTDSKRLDKIEQKLTQLKNEQEQINTDKYQEEINRVRLEAALASLKSEINERFGLDWEKKLQKKARHLNKKAALLRDKIKHKLELLGEVEPGAITAWERIKLRYQDLEQQKQDLKDGRAALEQIIAEMEKLMADQLKTTFNAVQKQFNAIFQELFEGGQANLQLTGNDILTAGLEISACPPGKRNQYLALLSGGEKALTAIAFIFALLKIKPSAFCIFDEVDTALDEANVERFNRLLHQFAAHTQFIVISHRQGTMAAADVLYGVTAVEQGVSRLLSVCLEQLPA